MSLTPTGGQWSRDYQLLTLHRETRTVNSVQGKHKHLAPDRWSPTGWKYVPGEVITSPYLFHPNKRNAYPCKRKPQNPLPDDQHLLTSSRLHYQRYTPDLYVKTEEEEVDREEFPPLPISLEKLDKVVSRLPKAARQRLLAYEGYHEPTPYLRLAVSPCNLTGTQEYPGRKRYNKRRTPLTEWMEHAIANRKDKALR